MSIRLSDEEAWDFVARSHTAVLTTLRRDGWPVPLPTWFVADGRRIYVRTSAASAKISRIRRDPRASFLVESGEAWRELAAVMLYVHATVLDPGEEADRAIRAIDAKYEAFREATAALPTATVRHYGDRVIVRLDPQSAPITWDNTKIRLRD